MAQVFQEFCDENMHRNFPLTDDASVTDTTGALTIPTNLMVDMYLCIPNTAGVDLSRFYVSNITVRQFFVDITLGHADLGAVIGTFRNITVGATLHTSYDFIPAEVEISGDLNPIYYATGQVTIGSAESMAQHPGSWSFVFAETPVSVTRVSEGLMNVQHIQADDRLFTGLVTLKEGNNVTLSVETTGTAPDADTTITMAASLTGDVGALDLQSDNDVLTALISRYGPPVQTINGIRPNSSMDFLIQGADCTKVQAVDNGLTFSNPCARPCGEESAEMSRALEDVGNLDLRYASLREFIEGVATELNANIQRMISLGAAEQ